MIQQFIGVGDILDIKQFYLRIGLGIKALVHILQHILDTNLLAVTNAPHTVKLQALDNRTLKNKYRCGTRSRDEIHTLRVQIGDRQRKHTMVVAVQQSDTVRTNECCSELFARIQDALFQFGTCLGLLAKSG